MKKFLNNILLSILSRFITLENIAALVARLIARLMEYARKRGNPAWEKTKGIVSEVNRYTSLFMEVYEDDTLTDEEEKKIAQAIVQGSNANKISDILERFKAEV